MMNNLKSAIALLAIGTSSFASAQDDVNSSNKNYYFQLNTGLSHSIDSTNDFSKVDLGNSGIYGVAVGSKINDSFSADLSMDYRPSFSSNYKTTTVEDDVVYSENHSIKVKSLVTMLNGNYNITTIDNDITPYLTFGMGISNNKTNQYSLNITDNLGSAPTNVIFSKGSRTNFAWKIGAGTKFALNNQFDLDLRYQYADLGKFKTGDSSSVDGAAYKSTKSLTGKIRSHEILLGLAYKF